MPTGLNINNVVPISVSLTPIAAAVRSFGVMLCLGDSNVINGQERYRLYNDLEGVAADFGTSAPEYLAAVAYFSQSPAPYEIMIGRWLRTATAGFVEGGVLTSGEQAIANWDEIDDGSFTIDVDGDSQDVTLLDFTAQTNLNGVATVITTGLSGAVCTWNGTRFLITSTTTGATSTVGYATAEGTGTDISEQLKLTEDLALTPIDGFAAETPVQAIEALDAISGLWYFSMFNCATQPTNDQALAVAEYIETASPSRVFGWNELDTRTLDSSWTDDLCAEFEAAGYQHSLTQYDPDTTVAVASLMGRQASVDFNGNNTTITLKFKQEPGITGQILTQNQANVLATKRGNAFLKYQNDTYIIQEGVMSSTLYIDERVGVDWLTSAIQSAVYNLLLTSSTKIFQTDAGMNQIAAAITSALDQGVNNGLIAPGIWNAEGFGAIVTGQMLESGYYVYTPPVATQSQADREARNSVLFQVGVKLAGAVHRAPIVLNINR